MKKIVKVVSLLTTFVLVQIPLSFAKDFKINNSLEKDTKVSSLSDEFNNQKRNEITKYNKETFEFNKCVKTFNDKGNYYNPPKISFQGANDEQYYHWRPKFYITKTESGQEVINKISPVNWNNRKINYKKDGCHEQFRGLEQPTIGITYTYQNGDAFEFKWKDERKDELIIYEKDQRGLTQSTFLKKCPVFVHAKDVDVPYEPTDILDVMKLDRYNKVETLPKYAKFLELVDNYGFICVREWYDPYKDINGEIIEDNLFEIPNS